MISLQDTVSRPERVIMNKDYNKIKKYVSDKEIATIRQKHEMESIVFTNGCFDIFHAGHAHLLTKARDLGDCLIVGVNTDSSVRQLKGVNRPINNLSERLMVLNCIEAINYLVIFDDLEPINLIEKVKPNILVKGSDYKNKYIAGSRYIENNDGKVVLIDNYSGMSSTGILNKFRY